MAGSKILELRPELSLSGHHLNAYFQQRQWEAVCEPLPQRDPVELPKWLPYVQEHALALRFEAEEAAPVLRHFPKLPTHVNWLGVADTLLLENSQWWPRLLMYETIRMVLIHRFSEVDTTLTAYIVGATPKGRAAAASLAALGFSRIRFVDHEPQRLQSEIQLLKRYLFSVDITGVDPETLTMETVPGSVMLNTLPAQDHSTALLDLSYFNFMKHGSVVIDIAECTNGSAFLEEAKSADLQTLTGLEYQSQLDVDLLQKLFPQHYLTYEDYFESFEEFLRVKDSSAKNPPSV